MTRVVVLSDKDVKPLVKFSSPRDHAHLLRQDDRRTVARIVESSMKDYGLDVYLAGSVLTNPIFNPDKPYRDVDLVLSTPLDKPGILDLFKQLREHSGKNSSPFDDGNLDMHFSTNLARVGAWYTVFDLDAQYQLVPLRKGFSDFKRAPIDLIMIHEEKLRGYF